MAPAGPVQPSSLQNQETPLGPSPMSQPPSNPPHPSIPCSHPLPTPSLGELSRRNDDITMVARATGRINQAEWAVAMVCILLLPGRLGICSLCAAQVPSPWGQGVLGDRKRGRQTSRGQQEVGASVGVSLSLESSLGLLDEVASAALTL